MWLSRVNAMKIGNACMKYGAMQRSECQVVMVMGRPVSFEVEDES